jgi:hypothetical protein
MTRIAMVVMDPGSDWPVQIGDSTSLVALCQDREHLLRTTQAPLGAIEPR